MHAPDNHYKPPVTALLEEPVSYDLNVARQGKRFWNLVIDPIALQVITRALAFLLVSVLGDRLTQGVALSITILLGIPFQLAYYIFMEARFGKTIGKFVTKTRVVNAQGGEASLGQIVGRSFARFIPFEVFSFLDSDPRGWHDSLPKTFVISE